RPIAAGSWCSASTSSLPVVWGYAGTRWDEAAGLYLMGARWYEPRTGRFIEQDPIGEAGGLNLYAYAAASPTIFVDRTGLRPDNPDHPSNLIRRIEADVSRVRGMLAGAHADFMRRERQLRDDHRKGHPGAKTTGVNPMADALLGSGWIRGSAELAWNGATGVFRSDAESDPKVDQVINVRAKADPIGFEDMEAARRRQKEFEESLKQIPTEFETGDKLDPKVIAILERFINRKVLEEIVLVKGAPVLSGFAAMTLRPYVFIDPKHYDPRSAAGLGLIAHEAKHIEQQRHEGLGYFLGTYAIETAIWIDLGFDVSDTHGMITWEREAIAFGDAVTRQLQRSGF
ncbi:MAG: DUF4157 domain-containing protein, partial [Acidobacteria bacterium]|nr:DUF4157 domain-containing protein [Acidobacteriota bacterium]